MAEHTSSFRLAQLPLWERPLGQHPSYTTSGAKLPIPVNTPAPSSPASPKNDNEDSHRSACEIDGAEFTILTPSPPPSPEDNIEDAASSARESETAIEPHVAPTFTNQDAVTRPKLRPYGPYGEGYVIEPTTEETRRQARAAIFDDVVASSSNPSSSDASLQTQSWSSKIALRPEKRERLRKKIRKEWEKVQEKVSKKARKVRVAEQMAFRRTCSISRKGVNKIKPFTNFLKDVARSTRVNDPIFRGRVTRLDALRPRLSNRNPRQQSRVSLLPPVSSGPEVIADAVGTLRGEHIPIRESFCPRRSVTGAHAMIVKLALRPSGSVSNEDMSEETTDVLCDRFDSHERVQMRIQLGRCSSIRAHMAAFHFNTLVPMDIVSRFPPAHRTATKPSNLIVATRDMMKLSRIWSEVVGPAPSLLKLENVNPLRILSDDEAEQLCKLVEAGLYRWAYWTLVTELSVNGGEEAMDDEWWGAFGQKLDDMGHPNIEAISRQLVVVGPNYTDVPVLESIISKTKTLNVCMSIHRKPTCRVPKTGLDDEMFELPGSTPEKEAAEPKTTEDPPAEQIHTSSILEWESEPSTPVREISAAAAPLPIGKEEQPNLAAQQIAHKERLRFQNWCDNAFPNEEFDLEEPVSSSPDISEEVKTALKDAAACKAAASLEPTEERRPSRVPPPVTMRRGQPALAKRGQTTTEQKKVQDHREPASLPVTRENGWISAAVLANSKPEDFKLEEFLPEEVVFPGPPEMSEKAKGELSMARSHSTRIFPGQVVARPYTGAAAPRILPRSTVPSRSVPKATTPRVPPAKASPERPVSVSVQQGIPQPRVQTQGISQVGHAGQTIPRTAFVAATMRPVSTTVKARATPKTSRTLPRSFTTRQSSALKSGPTQTSKSTRIEAARRILNSTAKPARDSGKTPSCSSLGARRETTAGKAFRVPLGPIVRSVMIVDTAAKSFGPATKRREDKIEILQVLSRPAVPVTLTKTFSMRRSRVPVPCRKAIMPGTYPKSDAGDDDQ